MEDVIYLDENFILSELNFSNLNLVVKQSVESTNTEVKNLPDSSNYCICIAEQQTAGRGRLNRRWHSPFAENIYFSLRLPFADSTVKLAGFSLVVSLAVIKTLQAFSLPNLKIKWPNDILFNQQKLAGILLEIEKSYIVIGIGININMCDAEVCQAWTSLKKITGENYDRNLIMIKLIENLRSYIEKFFQQSFAVFVDEYLSYDALIHTTIQLQTGEKIIKGIAKGVDNSGLLLLETAANIIQRFAAGEVSILKD